MMPSWCTHNFLFRCLIIFLIYIIENLSSTNDYQQHQVLKVDVGQDITMSCMFDEDNIEQVSFMRQMTGDILSLGSELFVHQSHIQLERFSSNRLDLKLLSVHENDSGIYTCMSNDERLISFFIEIFVPPRFLSYFPLEGSISYSENSSMNLSCYAFAIPQVNITWIFKNKYKQITNIHQGENLYISHVQSTDSGLYECIASNQYHASISRAFYITIQYSPRVLILNENLTNYLRDTILLKCRICSIPFVYQMIWLRENQQIHDENIQIKTEILNDECSISLFQINEINEEQFGQYECRGENLLGVKSDLISIEQISRIRKIKKISSEEINRNGRTAILMNKFSKKKKNQTLPIIKTVKDYQSHSNRMNTSVFFIFCICFIQLL